MSIWPIKGAILLRDNMPMAAFAELQEATEAIEMYAAKEKGVRFTVLSALGWMCSRHSVEINPEQENEPMRNSKVVTDDILTTIFCERPAILLRKISSLISSMNEIDHADRLTLNRLEETLIETLNVYHKIVNNIVHPHSKGGSS